MSDDKLTDEVNKVFEDTCILGHATITTDTSTTSHYGIQFCTDVILKEARNEARLVKQILLTVLNAFTNNPINLAINSPSGEGKSYVLHKVGELFPPQDVMFVAGLWVAVSNMTHRLHNFSFRYSSIAS